MYCSLEPAVQRIVRVIYYVTGLGEGAVVVCVPKDVQLFPRRFKYLKHL